jgi:hypothetical protein
MHLLDRSLLDALQAGALAALAVSLGLEGASRRDRTMGWLALTCLLVGLRHAVLLLGAPPVLGPGLPEQAQSLLTACGFIALCRTLGELFPHHVPRRFPVWMGLGLTPAFIRSLFFSRQGSWDLRLHLAADFAYLLGCGFIVWRTWKARGDGDRMGRRLFPSFLALSLPVGMELGAGGLFHPQLRVSGFSLAILALIIRDSWQWLAINSMETRLHRLEKELRAWKSLIPGTAFRTDQPSLWMEGLFGPGWSDRIRAQPEGPLSGPDGHPYRMRSVALYRRERVGCCERQGELPPGHRDFLSGWTVGFGMDDPGERTRIQGLLRSWGADLQFWGIVPPREGPFPSLLLWAREPSILAVWREDDLQRRRPRWIQIGGPLTQGPHARLEPGASDLDIRDVLEGLLARR